nr:hypothetical protein XF12B_52490 [Bradyrhizobium diazoefficiens]BCF62344.1 hypothetical protein XF18B_52920 [Bradyrhizobium diazoefficiens]
MSFLVDAIALRVQTTVEIEVDLLGRHGLPKKNAALAPGKISDRCEGGGPQFVIARRVVYQVQDPVHVYGLWMLR